MKVIVDGIEMFCNAILPGTAICDECSKQVMWDKYNSREGKEKTEGWIISEWRGGAAATCPECGTEKNSK